MVDFKQFYPFVTSLVFVGVILGVGMLVLSNFGASVRDVVREPNENVTAQDNHTVVTLAHVPLEEIILVFNGSDASATLTAGTDYTVNLVLGQITFYDHDYNQTQVNITYDYYSDSDATTGLNNVVTALAPISSSWIPLIVTVFALAVILAMVINGFKTKR